MCFVFVREQIATCATYIKNLLVFITEIKSVYSAVRTGALNEAVCAPSFKGSSYVCLKGKRRLNVGSARNLHSDWQPAAFSSTRCRGTQKPWINYSYGLLKGTPSVIIYMFIQQIGEQKSQASAHYTCEQYLLVFETQLSATKFSSVTPEFRLHNPLPPTDIYIYIYIYVCVCVCVSYCTANLQTLHFKYSTNIRTECFKHVAYFPFSFLQTAVYFIMLPCLVPVLFTF
jgi:hypothetical protein